MSAAPIPEQAAEPAAEADRAPRLVVVVLSWHGRDDTLRCVASIVEGDGCEVLVVDNGSHDGVLDAVAARWPEVHTLQTGRNLGFAGGMNAGLAWALDEGADVVCVLNNDTVIPAGVLGGLATGLDDRTAVSPEVRYLDDPSRVWFAGGTVEWSRNLPRHLGPSELPPAGTVRQPTDVLAGCCVLATSTVWRRVGLFDERYYLIFEDSDWSLRARRAGVELVVDRSVTISHAVSASLGSGYSDLSSFYYIRNSLLFGRDWGSSWRARARLLRTMVLPGVAAPARAGRPLESLARLAVVVWAVACYGLGRFGPAPRRLQRMAHRRRRHQSRSSRMSPAVPALAGTSPTGTAPAGTSPAGTDVDAEVGR